ncbi:MAG: AI-2E family transporter [Terriglobia bacterium]
MALTSSDKVAEETRLLKRLVFLLGFIVVAIILTFCYFAPEFWISIVLSAILAVLVDPLVVRMERHIRRTAAAGIVVLCGSLILLGLGFALYQRIKSFAAQLPQYEHQLQHQLGPMFKRLPVQKMNFTSVLMHGLGSVRTIVIVVAVAPFLVFFMLVRKDQMYFRASELIETSTDATGFISELNNVLRGVAYSYLLVGSAMAIILCVLFAALRLHGALVLGIISGYVNLIPYVGAIIAIILPIAGAMQQFSTPVPAIAIALTILALHFVLANIIAPKWIGPRAQVGPAAVLAGMLFWGWLWGILGIILAIPLTASLKVLADHHPRLSYFSDLLADQLDLSRRGPECNPPGKR